MKKNQISNFTPILTTEAGRCLTMENWQEAGVNMVACDLTALLMKPGLELLSVLPDLATWFGWQRGVVLNAAMPEIDREEGYTIRSEYDGSRRRYTLNEILVLIAQLKPQLVLLPEGACKGWQSLPHTILPFFAPGNLPQDVERPFGVYFLYDTAIAFSALVQQIQNYPSLPCYVGGELSLPLIKKLSDLGVQYIASDIPARDACQGMVYHSDGVLSLKEHALRLDFGVIDQQCQCPMCKQLLTRAYLHHLLEHTPLLCQRFLIQHNVSFVNQL